MTFIILLLLLVLFSTYHIGFGFVPGAVPLRRQAAHQVSPFTPKVGRAIVNTPEKGKYEEEHRMPGEAVLPRVAERVNRETATRLYRGLGEDDVEEVPPTGAMHMHGFDLELPRPAVDPDGDPLVYLPCDGHHAQGTISKRQAPTSSSRWFNIGGESFKPPTSYSRHQHPDAPIKPTAEAINEAVDLECFQILRQGFGGIPPDAGTADDHSPPSLVPGTLEYAVHEELGHMIHDAWCGCVRIPADTTGDATSAAAKAVSVQSLSSVSSKSANTVVVRHHKAEKRFGRISAGPREVFEGTGGTDRKKDEVNDRDDSSVPSSKSGSPQGKKGWIRKLLGRMRRKE